MNYIEVEPSNINQEHICCAISETKKDMRVTTKKEWMKKTFKDGLKFIKLNERGKVFIEYMPSEKAWSPIIAPNTFFINCLWVSGKYTKKGHGSALLDICIKDAKKEDKDGIVIISSDKKRPFLSEPKFLIQKGFEIVDSVGYFRLLFLPLKENVPKPKFSSSVRDLKINDKGIVIYYSNQCPHTEMYVKIMEEYAMENQLQFKKIRFNSFVEAQQGQAPFTTYSLFVDGKFITNEILGPKKIGEYLLGD